MMYPILLHGAIILWLFLCIPSISAAQDSTTTASSNQPADSSSQPYNVPIRFRISGAHYYQTAAPMFGTTAWTKSPEYLQPRRKGDPLGVDQRWDLQGNELTDNPLFHGAGFISLTMNTTPVPGVELLGELIGEMRGMSYGVNNTKNTVVWPRYRFTVDTALTLFGERIQGHLEVGNFTNATAGEGLTFYNMETQGTCFTIRWRWLQYQFIQYGDAVNGVGLNIDDAIHASIGLKDIPFAGLHFDFNIGDFGYTRVWINWPDHYRSPRAELATRVGLMDNGYTLFGNISHGSNARLYGQWAQRASSSNEFPISRSAWLIGAEHTDTVLGICYAARVEQRYYGGLFNYGFRNTDVYYRDPEKINYQNTVGSYLAPLTVMERPFSQWSVFTEYQSLKEIFGRSIYVKATYPIWKAVSLSLLLDWNNFAVEGLPIFSHLFYEFGAKWEPFHDIDFTISATNRALNLDKHYPTIYQLEDPLLYIAFRWNVAGQF